VRGVHNVPKKKMRKSGKTKWKKGECVLCGRKRQVTREHTLPKCIFPEPRPSNLITVPACRKCNSASSKDDEYFRLMLTLRDDIHAIPLVRQKLWPKVRRSLQKETKRGFQSALFQNICQVPVFTESGIYVGRRGGYHVDERRLEKVVERTVKGLFYHLQKRVLPSSSGVHVWCESRFSAMPNDARDHILGIALAIWESDGKAATIGDDVFSYKVAFFREDDNASAWLLNFFKRVSFMGLTLSGHNMPKRQKRVIP
jgi:hypothetical protein